MENKSKTKGIAVLVIAIIGIIIMIAKSGIFGIVVYLIAAAISLFSLSKEDRASVSSIISYIKDSVRNISSDTFFSDGIFALILALLPIAIIVGLFMCFYIEPMRAADSAIDDAIDALDSLF
jgi:hypothetical protein